MNAKTCAFTGHRPQNLPFGFNEADKRCVELKKVMNEQIIRLIEDGGVCHFISGMAIGIDMYAAEIVLRLMNSRPDITLECAIPCESQPLKWSAEMRERYFRICERCSKKTVLQREYTQDCMQRRNKYMVDSADIILAVWDGKPSGTGSTVRYAKSRGRSVIVIDPFSLSVRRLP